MSWLDARGVVNWPTGDNSTDTVVGGVHFNLTTLNFFNYTYYSNGTLSNNSWCMLAFDDYTPRGVLDNGTFINSTTCFTPYYGTGARAYGGIGYTVFYALSLMFTMIHLRKHGSRFLPAEKRFRPVGRRWVWYWLAATGGLGLMAGIGAIDVDRYYLPEFPIVLTNLGYFLQLICVMGAIWESVRHWGSWQERQVIDPDPFSLPQDDRRATVEFYLPLVFYMFNFLNFFMTIPRSWEPIEMQRSPEQTEQIGKPNATDARWKAGAFLMFCAWLVICFSLGHSLYYYKPKTRGIFGKIGGFFRNTPIKFILILPLALVMIGYEALIAWDFDVSPLNIHGNVAYIYGLGWGPIALIVLILEICGYIDPNEDKDLIRQRRLRGIAIDEEMGYVPKPRWWRRLHGDHNLSVQAAIAKNVKEVGGGAATHKNIERGIEMGILAPKKTEEELMRDIRAKRQVPDSVRAGAALLFGGGDGAQSPPPRYTDVAPAVTLGRGREAEWPTTSVRGAHRSEMPDRSTSTDSEQTLSGRKPQQVKSMLDV